MSTSFYLNGRKIRRGKQVKACCLTAQNRVNMNPFSTEGLESTAVGVPSGWIGIVPNGATEVRFEFTTEKTDGAIELHYNRNRTSCWFAAGDLLAEYPVLRVEKGYQRQLAWRIDDNGSRKWFIVSLVDQPVVPTKKRAPKKAPPVKADAT